MNVFHSHHLTMRVNQNASHLHFLCHGYILLNEVSSILFGTGESGNLCTKSVWQAK